jgi:hypothetical protein
VTLLCNALEPGRSAAIQWSSSVRTVEESTEFGVEPARPKGFEPLTGGLEIHCSIQLSYGRVWGTEWLSRTGSSSWMGKPHAAALVAL